MQTEDEKIERQEAKVVERRGQDGEEGGKVCRQRVKYGGKGSEGCRQKTTTDMKEEKVADLKGQEGEEEGKCRKNGRQRKKKKIVERTVKDGEGGKCHRQTIKKQKQEAKIVEKRGRDDDEGRKGCRQQRTRLR